MLVTSVKDYVAQLRERSHEVLTLAVLLQPFGMTTRGGETEGSLLVAFLLEAVLESYEETDRIDPLDVAELASDLGLAEADLFLRDGARLLFAMAKSETQLF